MNASEYLKIVEEQIRQKAIAPELVDELKHHIDEQTLAYVEQGMEEDAAVEKAVADMGDPVETGIQLDMVHQPRLDGKLFVLVLAGLMLSSVLSIYLSWNNMESKYIMWFGSSIVILLILSFSRYNYTYAKYPLFLWLIYFCGFAVYISPALGRISPISAQALLNCSLTGFAAISYTCRDRNSGKLHKMVGTGIIACAASMVFRSFFYTYFLLVAHAVIATYGIFRGWYTSSRKKALIITWAAPTVLLPVGLFLLFRGLLQQSWREGLASYLSRTDIPGFLVRNLGSVGILILILWSLMLLAFLFRMARNMRRLTNQLCRILCLSVLAAFSVSYLQSLMGVLGYGSAAEIYFPFFSMGAVSNGMEKYFYVILAGLFLQLHRQDPVIARTWPKKV